MSISLKQVRAFVTLAESRTYVEAANRLHMSQPALSLSIKALEEQLGGALLERTTRSFSLTPEAHSFFLQAKPLLKQWDETIESIQERFQLKSGEVSIAVMPTFAATLLPKVLKSFRNTYPEVALSLNDVIAEETVEMVRNGKVEIGISFRPKALDDVNFTPLFIDDFLAVLPQEHMLADMNSVAFEDVLSEPLLLLQAPSLVSQLIRNAAHSKQLSLHCDMEAHQLATIGRMVSEGLGVSIVPSVCAQQMTEMGTICRPLKDIDISSEVGLLTSKNQALSAASMHFIDIIKREFKSHTVQSATQTTQD